MKKLPYYTIIPFVPPTAQGSPPDIADAETLPASASIVRAWAGGFANHWIVAQASEEDLANAGRDQAGPHPASFVIWFATNICHLHHYTIYIMFDVPTRT